MLIHPNKIISIYFGNALTDTVSHKSPAYQDFCIKIIEHLQLDHLILQHQTHGLDGIIVNQQPSKKTVLFEQDGDWLATNQKQIGLGILTADCLPLIFYDKVKQAVGIAHAGWKGTVTGIAQKVIDVMRTNYGSHPSDITVFFGPSACSCCYEVGKEFEAYMTDDQLKKSLIERDGKLFFDTACYNTTLLLRAGVDKKNLDYHYHVCTICNHQFHSHRRKAILRQATIVFINSPTHSR